MGSLSSNFYWIVALSSIAVGALWAWVVGPLLFQRERQQTPQIVPSLILPIAIVLLIQIALVWSFATAIGPAAQPAIPVDGISAAANAGEHQRILAAIDELNERPIVLPQPSTNQTITPLGWIVLLSLPFVAAGLALLFAFFFDRFFGRLVGKSTAAAAGGLLSIPFTLLGTFNLYEKLNLDFFNDFALFKIEQHQEVDTKAIADAVADEIGKRIDDQLVARISNDIAIIVNQIATRQFIEQITTSIVNGVTIEISNKVSKTLVENISNQTVNNVSQTLVENVTTQIVDKLHHEIGVDISDAAIDKLLDLLKNRSPETPGTGIDTLSRDGTVDCGSNSEFIIGQFVLGRPDKLEKGDINPQMAKLIERLTQKRSEQYLSAIILIGSADRSPRAKPKTNDQLATDRAQWVKKLFGEELSKVVGVISPPEIIVINELVSQLRVSRNDGRDLDRAVQVCSLWVPS